MPRVMIDPRQVRRMEPALERLDRADPPGRARSDASEDTSTRSQGHPMFGSMRISRVKVDCTFTQLNEAAVNVTLNGMPEDATLLFSAIKTKTVRGLYINGQRQASIRGGGADFEVVSGPEDDLEIRMDFRLKASGQGDLILLDLKDPVLPNLVQTLHAQVQELQEQMER